MPSGPKSVLRVPAALAPSSALVRSDARSLKSLGHFGAIGVEMAVFIVLGVKAGQWLDARYQVSYWTLVGLAFGLFAGFRSLFQLTRRHRQQAARQQAAQNAQLETSNA